MKIKPNELRIGNILNWMNIPCPVVQIDEEDFTVADNAQSKLNSNYHYSSDEVISYFELTEEWLLEFGFEKPKNRDCYIKKRLQVFKQMVYLIEEDTIKAHWIPIKLEYVHQLQNIYYSFIGEELILNDKDGE